MYSETFITEATTMLGLVHVCLVLLLAIRQSVEAEMCADCHLL
jgi:hypothetical protein